MGKQIQEILTFIVEKQRFAIQLQTVERVIRAVAVTKLTNSPSFIEGVIDYYGEIIAVINLRKRLGYPIHELKLSDRLIITITTNRKIALLVDQVEDVILPDSQDLYDSQDLGAGMELATVLRDDNGIVMIYDLENLLSKSEEIQLDKFIETNIEPTIDL